MECESGGRRRKKDSPTKLVDQCLRTSWVENKPKKYQRKSRLTKKRRRCAFASHSPKNEGRNRNEIVREKLYVSGEKTESAKPDFDKHVR